MRAATLVAAIKASIDGRILDTKVTHVVQAGCRRSRAVVALLLEERLHVVLDGRLQ